MEKTDNRKLEDDEIISILAKEVKQRRESLVEFEKGNRQDLVDQCKAEIEILLKYLPQQLDEEEIRKIIIESAEQVGANSIKDMGKVMSAVKPKVVGRADGKLVSQIVKDYLNNKVLSYYLFAKYKKLLEIINFQMLTDKICALNRES